MRENHQQPVVEDRNGRLHLRRRHSPTCRPSAGLALLFCLGSGIFGKPISIAEPFHREMLETFGITLASGDRA